MNKIEELEKTLETMRLNYSKEFSTVRKELIALKAEQLENADLMLQNKRLREALEEIVDWHIETHEDAYEMRNIAKQALEQSDGHS